MSLLARTRQGLLDLHFAVRGGKTVLLRDIQKAPLMVVRPFELPCGTLMAFIVNPTGGVLGGDHSEIHVQVDAGARVLLLTQSATRVQPSVSGEQAVQDITFSVQSGARLEYYPERTIPFARSNFSQTVLVTLEGQAEFGMTESLAAGRVQMGERLAFQSYRSRISIYLDGQRIFLDAQQLGDLTLARAPGLWGNMNYLTGGVWVSPSAKQEFTRRPNFAGQLSCGWSHGGALWLRAAALDSLSADRGVTRFREFVRAELFGAAALCIRR